jgi:hypothetical protein
MPMKITDEDFEALSDEQLDDISSGVLSVLTQLINDFESEGGNIYRESDEYEE